MGCTAVKINLVIYEGGTFDQEFQWKTGSTPTPVDLTNYTAKMMVRVLLNSANPVISLIEKTSTWTADAASGIYLDNAINGKYRIYIKNEDSMGICETHTNIDGVYDLFLISASGESVLKQYGTAKLIAAVTR